MLYVPHENNPLTGLKRLNKLPLIIVGLLIALVILALVFVAYQRAGTLQQTAEDFENSITLQPATSTLNAILQEQPDNSIAAREPADVIKAPANLALPALPQGNTQQKAEQRLIQVKQQRLAGAYIADTGLPVKERTATSISLPARSIDNADAKSPVLEDSNGQVQKTAFLERSFSTYTLAHQRQAQRSAFSIKTGTIIPAVMITGINSDLPGQITAQVSQHVYDTASGEYLLIPQGSKIIGRYDSKITYGQQRVLVAWHRIVFPDASTLELDTMAGTDAAGYAGFSDEVDNHYLRIFGSAFMLSIISAGYQLSQPDSSTDDAQAVIGGTLGLQMAQVGMEMVNRNLNIQPTLKIRPGYTFNVMINKDMVFSSAYK